MYKVSVVTHDGRKFGSTFKEIEQANSWVNSHKRKNTWGLPEREVVYHEHQSRDPRAIEHENLPDNKVKCVIPSDYKIVIEQVEGADPVHLVLKRLREERNKILDSNDKVMLADYPLSSPEKKHWREYRQYLRDITKSYDNVTIYKYKIMNFEEWKKWKHKK